MKRRDKCSEYVKYEFTEAEHLENAKVLARKNRNLSEHDLKKKALAADLKNEEEALKNEIAQYSRYVTDGMDFRMMECHILYDFPEVGMKTIQRIDTGETVKKERMSDEEKQTTMEFN